MRKSNYNSTIYFPVSGIKHYENRYYTNNLNSFANVSITGEQCICACDHCNGKLLKSMEYTETPEKLRIYIKKISQAGSTGILISGGANERGEVPLHPFLSSIEYAKELKLKVIVHSGLITESVAKDLKVAGVDQILMDVIGDESTIKKVYHIDRKPQDYLKSMLSCKKAGLRIAPHVVLGLHYGELKGEMKALEMIIEALPQVLVFVVITPKRGTKMEGINPPNPNSLVKIISKARKELPNIPITLGCAKPPGSYKRELEILAIKCGVNAIAYPDEKTVEFAQKMGIKTIFTQECCSILV